MKLSSILFCYIPIICNELITPFAKPLLRANSNNKTTDEFIVDLNNYVCCEQFKLINNVTYSNKFCSFLF